MKHSVTWPVTDRACAGRETFRCSIRVLCFSSDSWLLLWCHCSSTLGAEFLPPLLRRRGTRNVLLAGYRIRFYVSSGNFHRFNRNLNISGPNARARRMMAARRTIYPDAEHPSALVLPEVPVRH